jgi:hypothetical protein
MGRWIAAAVVASSIVGVLTYIVVLTAAAAVTDGLDAVPIAQASTGLLLVFFFGWPFALAITAGLGVPLFHFLRDRGSYSFGAVLAIGTVAGAAIVPMTWLILWGKIEQFPVWLGAGSIVGLATSVTFWLVMQKPLRSI